MATKGRKQNHCRTTETEKVAVLFKWEQWEVLVSGGAAASLQPCLLILKTLQERGGAPGADAPRFRKWLTPPFRLGWLPKARSGCP